MIVYATNMLEVITYAHYESKTTVLQFLQFFLSFITLSAELFFFWYVSKTFGVPLNLIIEVLYTVTNLYQILLSFYNSIVLVSRLKKLPDVIPAEDPNVDSTCLICLHEITEGKKIKCGHVFHFNCLKNWIQGNTNQFCPKCKKPIEINTKNTTTSANLFNQMNNNNNQFGLDLNAPQFQAPAEDNEPQLGNAGEDDDIVSIRREQQKRNNESLQITMEYKQIVAKHRELSRLAQDKSEEELLDDILQDIFVNYNEYSAKVGAIVNGLPRQAKSYHSRSDELIKKKIQLINKLVFNSSQFILNGAQQVEISKKKKVEISQDNQEIIEKPEIDLDPSKTDEQDERELRRNKFLEQLQRRQSSGVTIEQ